MYMLKPLLRELYEQIKHIHPYLVASKRITFNLVKMVRYIHATS